VVFSDSGIGGVATGIRQQLPLTLGARRPEAIVGKLQRCGMRQQDRVRVAALCRDHGVRELWSADRDFGRFAGLTVVNPLVRDQTG